MSRLHCWRTRNNASGTAPRARLNEGWAASSASHSARNSRRRLDGARRATRPMKRRGRSRMALARTEAAKALEALQRGLQRGAAGPGDLVVAPRRTLLAAGDLLALPARSHEAER